MTSSVACDSVARNRLLPSGVGGFRVWCLLALIFASHGSHAGDLHTAASEGRMIEVEHHLENAVSVDALDSQGRTAFWHACGAGRLKVAERLADAGADLERLDRYGVSPLVVAIRRGHTGIVDFLVERDVRVNLVGRERFIPLHVAVEQGKPEIVFALLAAGAAPLLQMETGDPGTDLTRNAMIRSRVRGMVQNALWLVDGKGPLTVSFPLDREQDSVLVEVTRDTRVVFSTVARHRLRPPEARLELDVGQAFEEIIPEGRYRVRLGLSDGSRDSRVYIAATSVSLGVIGTALYGQPEVLASILASGANPNAADRLGRTALMLCAAFAADLSVTTLLAAGADPHVRDHEGRTAQDYADLFAPNHRVGKLIHQATERTTISR